jgi:REP element-mobilizing transposase RayT
MRMATGLVFTPGVPGLPPWLRGRGRRSMVLGSRVMVAALAACSRCPRASAQGFLTDKVYVRTLFGMPNAANTIFQPDPLAFFLTWTTYGSWMPGDARGWADDRGMIREPNARLARVAAGLMRGTSVVLTFAQRDTVERTIHEHCDFRGWTLHAATCRTTHVHVVVSAAERTPDGVLGSIKARCSRHLSQEDEGPRTWWTRGGSMRHIYDTRSLENVVMYVVECQDKPRP